MPNTNIMLRFQFTGSAVTAVAEYQPGETAVLPGNLSLTGDSRRITGDMSNATVASRLLFQTSIANGATSISAVPNGTSNIAVISAFSAASAANCSLAALYTDGVGSYVSSDRLGTGTYLPLIFTVGGAERIRVTTGGDVCIGASTADPINGGVKGVAWQSAAGLMQVRSGSAGVAAINFGAPGGVSANLAGFFAGTTGVGSITTNGTTTAYNTSSDYRLKDNVQPLDVDEAVERIMAYRPVTWTWKSDGSYGKGFIAHECQAVDPMTATGVKDQTERVGRISLADGAVVAESVREPEDLSIYGEGATWELTEVRAVYQGRDDSKMIPDLIAMVQRMELRIRELEAQLHQALASRPAA